MKQLWENLSDAHKRLIVVISMLGIVAIFIYLIMPSQPSDNKMPSGPTIKHVLTDTNTREISLNSLSAQLKRLELMNDQLKKEVNTLYQETQYLKKIQHETQKQNKSFVNSEQTEVISSSVQIPPNPVKAQSKELIEESSPISPENIIINKPGTTVDFNDDSELNNLSSDARAIKATGIAKDILPVYQSIEPNRRFYEAIETSGNIVVNNGIQPTPSAMAIRTISKPVIEIVEDKPTPESIRLLAGSIIQGRLITGMDAPTHDSAKREPFPALLRIQKEAILPNRHRSDIRECFLIMGGYGDLSSERAYLRGETLSCVLEDNNVIETPLEGYAAGEDGKAGIRGRLVSKQGQLVAKSMMAGFLQGLSGAFDVNPIQAIQMNDIGRTPLYQSVLSSDALQGAAIKGTGKALDRIAKFYLDMAENMFPVIEIDAAREIEIIITKGLVL
ncbi:TraB/VirB10 family protein [Thorsellia anophelis]|uniref:Conjugal transfer pilus assembly protein TraB n=1 Tax=Thorsellia anophelis DSM 18579 TaxID=1123402 RepID=A0A1I0CZ92_9GAMM|nr:TraB/VirB10 family protein [Thorsellia anophelis]SET25200.1 conjugal transfer pilus assembly protein TraB [Thorsellia anophelis DSM 18579]